MNEEGGAFPAICHLSRKTQKFLTRFCQNNDWKHFLATLQSEKFIMKLLVRFRENGKEISGEGGKFMMELRQEKEVLLWTTLSQTNPNRRRVISRALLGVGRVATPPKRLRNERRNEKLVEIIYETVTTLFQKGKDFAPLGRLAWKTNSGNRRENLLRLIISTKDICLSDWMAFIVIITISLLIVTNETKSQFEMRRWKGRNQNNQHFFKFSMGFLANVLLRITIKRGSSSLTMFFVPFSSFLSLRQLKKYFDNGTCSSKFRFSTPISISWQCSKEAKTLTLNIFTSC
jgi:hypothetical protein